MNLAVIDASTGEELPGIPTPFLAQSGGGEAFLRGSDAQPVWFAKQPGYESADGNYRRVRVVETNQYDVEVDITVTIPYNDTLYVDATDKVTAATKAIEKASANARKAFGNDIRVESKVVSAGLSR